MAHNEIVIECKRVRFYASYDEDAFFEWLKKIKSVIQVKGVKDSLFITVTGLSDEELYNLVGLFRRYKIKGYTLEHMLPDSQKELFHAYQKGYHINRYPAV